MRPLKSHQSPPERRFSQKTREPKKKESFFSTFFSSGIPFLGKTKRSRKREYTFLRSRVYTGLALMTVAAGGALYALEYPQWWYEQTMNSVLRLSQKFGFRVEDISVVGRHQTASEEILTRINLKYKDPIFQYSPAEIRENLKQISWVKDAHVQRRLPRTVYIKIQERVPLAIWQHQQKHMLVDDEGVVISHDKLQHYKHLPVIVGTDAPLHVSEILTLLSKNPEIQSRVTAIVRVSGRRWNLKLDKTIDVKLPEKDMDKALENLKKLLKQEKINFKEVKAIDLRQPTQTTLRLSGAAELHLIGRGVDA